MDERLWLRALLNTEQAVLKGVESCMKQAVPLAIPVLSEQELASCVDKQTHPELKAGFLRSMTNPRRLCTSEVPSTHSSLSVPSGKTRTPRRVNRSKTLPPSMTVRLSAHTTPKSNSRLTTLSQRQHGVLPTSSCPLNEKKALSFNKTTRVSELYPQNIQIAPLVSYGHNFGFPAPISKRKPPSERRARQLPARRFLLLRNKRLGCTKAATARDPQKLARSDLLNVLVPGRGYILADHRVRIRVRESEVNPWYGYFFKQ